MEKLKILLKSSFIYIIIIIGIVLVKKYIVTPIRVYGPSMDNTLKHGDIMILNELTNKFERFDIVVIKLDNELIIKRIIGLPGEELEYKDNKLYIDGKYIKEDFNHGETENFEKLKIEENNYFVLGDNRPVSSDSRVFGTIEKNDIIGKTSLTLFPFTRIGIKK